jgi:ABC-type sugar transport system substrate-binding protein
MIARARKSAREGDVVFKNGGGVWGSLAARFSENDDGYGHVGIVSLRPDGEVIVIHAGGDPVTRNGRVQESEFDKFLGAAKGAALYRPHLDDASAARALTYAQDAVRRNAPFDAAFSLETENALYCTELIWRALSVALGEDAVPEKSERSGKIYVAIDDLQDSRFLEPIWRSDE